MLMKKDFISNDFRIRIERECFYRRNIVPMIVHVEYREKYVAFLMGNENNWQSICKLIRKAKKELTF